jgi:hypothetical protein
MPSKTTFVDRFVVTDVLYMSDVLAAAANGWRCNTHEQEFS